MVRFAQRACPRFGKRRAGIQEAARREPPPLLIAVGAEYAESGWSTERQSASSRAGAIATHESAASCAQGFVKLEVGQFLY